MSQSAEKIADKLIAQSRGILTKNRWKEAVDIITLPIPVPHVMPIETYRERFGACLERNNDH